MQGLRLKRPDEPWWKALLALLGWLFLLVGLAGLAVRQLHSSSQTLIVMAAFARYVLLGGLVALILLAISWRRVGMVLALVATIGAVATQLPLYLASGAAASGPQLTLMQSNLKIGAADPATIVREVRARQVQVLATEELTPVERDRLVAAGLSTLLPYRLDAAHTGGQGLALWSKYPMSDEQNHPGFELGVLSARIALPGGESPTVFAVHILPPWPESPAVWLKELPKLQAILATQQGQVVVAGDFNATVDDAQFRALLRNGFQDAADQSGAGYLATYPADRWYPPLIAIDHVLTRRAKAENLSTIEVPGSDHRSLLVHLRLTT